MTIRKPIFAGLIGLAVLAGCKGRYERAGEKIARCIIEADTGETPEDHPESYLPGMLDYMTRTYTKLLRNADKSEHGARLLALSLSTETAAACYERHRPR